MHWQKPVGLDPFVYQPDSTGAHHTGPAALGCARRRCVTVLLPHIRRPIGDRLIRPSAIGGFATHETDLGTFFTATVAAAVRARTFHVETGVR